jgi:hypothetical protein
MDACDWEQEIEDVIEQSAFGETQRANSVYIKPATKRHKSHKRGDSSVNLCLFCGRFLFGIRKVVNYRQRSIDLLEQQHPRQIMSERQWRE